MDSPNSKIVVTGAGCAEPDAEADARPYLRTPKMRKLLGVWDTMAIMASAQAIKAAGLPESLGESTGLFTAVGHVPITEKTLEACTLGSQDENGNFNGQLHAKGGYLNFNPIFVFRSMANSPAFFVSSCFDIQGPYFVTFSGSGQFYLALEEGILALREGRAEIAIVGAAADQDNQLVSFHFSRTDPPVAEDQIHSCAGFLVLETAEHAAARGVTPYAVLEDWAIEYETHDPLMRSFPHEESFEPPGPCSEGYWGPGSLPMTIAQAKVGTLKHILRSRDGIRANSRWEVRK